MAGRTLALAVRVAAPVPRRLQSSLAPQPRRSPESEAGPEQLKPRVARTQVEHVQRAEKMPQSPCPATTIRFQDPREAYRSKATWELLRSLLVFRLCTYNVLVDHNQQLMNISRAILGKWLFEKMMKMTFYGQFVAGEDQESIKPLIRKNQAFGVGSVLDYGVEEDLTQEEAEKKDVESCTAEAEREQNDHREKKYKVSSGFGDRRGGVISARTYFYADEGKCDQHMETFLKCIEASGGSSKDGFSAIKLTALGRPQFLLQFSEVLIRWQRFFHQLAAEQGKAGMAVVDIQLEAKQLQETLENLGIVTKAESQHWFTGEDLGVSGTVDLLDWNSLIDSRTKISKLLLVPNLQTGHLEPLLSRFTENEDLQMKRMLQRMDILAKKALEMGVRLMIDAEQTYFQPAISRLTLEMQRKFNTEKPIIFNTYQCYLKEAYDNVSADVELSRREGWHFGAKLVRGAYMQQERKRAADLGYEDPINPTYEKTNEMYYRCLDYVLEDIKNNRKANVMVASHNEDTVVFTLRRMNELGIQPSEGKVYFGQLLGMCDQISFPLGQAGYPVYKYVPYGPVNEVLPYLSRRAQENRGFMKGAVRERHLLWTEFKRRLLSGDLFYSPSY
ncbi:proline dehydrogenase 1, mitochondrial-like [Rhinatrema bivittatum]|uniref:proline dehydrogenase 1, mitochondrial-like n=1 Tax=Rhinatrema bivittatum TaxID=194408 RepID=UPI00112AE436|nr:proline dehydrogenase 1, mitochondrial-like [Rhinatrema bivittatum]